MGLVVMADSDVRIPPSNASLWGGVGGVRGTKGRGAAHAPQLNQRLAAGQIGAPAAVLRGAAARGRSLQGQRQAGGPADMGRKAGGQRCSGSGTWLRACGGNNPPPPPVWAGHANRRLTAARGRRLGSRAYGRRADGLAGLPDAPAIVHHVRDDRPETWLIGGMFAWRMPGALPLY